MSDQGRRRRYNRRNRDDRRPTDIQPKILLKNNACDSSSSTAQQPIPTQKTIIFQKATPSPALSPNTTKEQHNTEILEPSNIVEPMYRQTRPATVISSTNSINSGAKKLLMKTNTDFFVCAVVGTQGVGKSTILNLLANEQLQFDYYTKVFVEEDCIFPTKIKINKCAARSRTESTHMYITQDRLILLDSPPVLSNAYKKDMTTAMLDDISSLMCLMSVCHLLIVVEDNYFNLNFLNLLRFAELMKPAQETKPIVYDYFPNVLFVKNHAIRNDFNESSKKCYDQMLKALFKDSQLGIHKGQTREQQHLTGSQQQQQQQQKQKRNRSLELEKEVNSFLFPEVTNHVEDLDEIIKQFRTQVFTTPRNPMCSGELTEERWFDLLNKVSQEKHNFFFNQYEDIQRKQLCITDKTNASKETVESWRE